MDTHRSSPDFGTVWVEPHFLPKRPKQDPVGFPYESPFSRMSRDSLAKGMVPLT